MFMPGLGTRHRNSIADDGEDVAWNLKPARWRDAERTWKPMIVT
jgi:hypothetical protein